jgi:hypothetical protein
VHTSQPPSDDLLGASPSCQDLRRLRQLAAVRGLVNAPLRARLWATLSGADLSVVDGDAYSAAAAGRHRDSGTVDCDVARSLWAFMPRADDEERTTTRAALARLLNAVVVHHGGDVHYYQVGGEIEVGERGGGEGGRGGGGGGRPRRQCRACFQSGIEHRGRGRCTAAVTGGVVPGMRETAAQARVAGCLCGGAAPSKAGVASPFSRPTPLLARHPQGLHDVASVLLLIAGERAAFSILCRLATGALRDATRPTLDPVLELLGLMGPVLEVRHATCRVPGRAVDLLHCS